MQNADSICTGHKRYTWDLMILHWQLQPFLETNPSIVWWFQCFGKWLVKPWAVLSSAQVTRGNGSRWVGGSHQRSTVNVPTASEAWLVMDCSSPKALGTLFWQGSSHHQNEVTTVWPSGSQTSKYIRRTWRTVINAESRAPPWGGPGNLQYEQIWEILTQEVWRPHLRRLWVLLFQVGRTQAGFNGLLQCLSLWNGDSQAHFIGFGQWGQHIGKPHTWHRVGPSVSTTTPYFENLHHSEKKWWWSPSSN